MFRCTYDNSVNNLRADETQAYPLQSTQAVSHTVISSQTIFTDEVCMRQKAKDIYTGRSEGHVRGGLASLTYAVVERDHNASF